MTVRKLGKQRRFAMTLIELLLVIVTIGVLAGLLLPMLAGRGHPRTPVARTEMAGLAAAITHYETAYKHFPIADSITNSDVTIGINSADILGFQKIAGTRLVAANSDMMIILLDIDRGINAGHKMNPQKTVFYNAHMVNDTKSAGVSRVDLQFRDPWGSPYIISLDSNYDNRVRDACYASANLATNEMAGQLTNNNGIYELSGSVMVWSRGPDRKLSATNQASKGVNRDNVLSWR